MDDNKIAAIMAGQTIVVSSIVELLITKGHLQKKDVIKALLNVKDALILNKRTESLPAIMHILELLLDENSIRNDKDMH